MPQKWEHLMVVVRGNYYSIDDEINREIKARGDLCYELVAVIVVPENLYKRELYFKRSVQ